MRTLVFAGFLFAHGLVHASFIAPAPPSARGGPPWPFRLDRSWLLTRMDVNPEAMVAAGRALVAVTVAGFALAAVGVLLEASWWAPVVAAVAAASLLQLLVWFHWWLPLGVLIDIALIIGLLWRPWQAVWT